MSGCEKYAELMNRYLDGDLPASQISDLLDHLETCASCRNRFDALKIMAFEMIYHKNGLFCFKIEILYINLLFN